MCMGGNLSILIVSLPPSLSRDPQLFQLGGRGHMAGGKGGGLLGGRGQGWRGTGKRAIVSKTCGCLGGQGQNEESPAVQSGRALPLGRCASPPWGIWALFLCIETSIYMLVIYSLIVKYTNRIYMTVSKYLFMIQKF